jgi:hypothetical protein
MRKVDSNMKPDSKQTEQTSLPQTSPPQKADRVKKVSIRSALSSSERRNKLKNLSGMDSGELLTSGVEKTTELNQGDESQDSYQHYTSPEFAEALLKHFSVAVSRVPLPKGEGPG